MFLVGLGKVVLNVILPKRRTCLSGLNFEIFQKVAFEIFVEIRFYVMKSTAKQFGQVTELFGSAEL